MRLLVRALTVVAISAAASGAALVAHVAQAEAPAARSPKLVQGTPAQRDLGKKLFNDTRLSSTGTISCASCHQVDKAFTDGRPVALGIHNLAGPRNSPTLLNVGHHRAFFWDGRTPLLEQQVLEPLVHPREHGFANMEQALAVLRADPDYRVAFAKAFPKDKQAIQEPQLAAALSAFVRSLVSPQSAIDRFVLLNDTKALSPEAQAGFLVFKGRAGCAGCHMLSDDAGTGRVQLSDQRFHAHGAHFYGQEDRMQQLARKLLKSGASLDDLRNDRMAEFSSLGRFLVSGKISDVGAFKTPTLRNISKTAPYFHDGGVASLETAVDRELLIPGSEIRISPEDKRLLLVFLQALDDDPQ